MVNIASFDQAVQVRNQPVAPAQNTATSNQNFSNSLKTATDAQATTVIDDKITMSDSHSVVEEKVEQEDSKPLTLDFLLPTPKVEVMQEEVLGIDLAALFNATSIEDITTLMGGKFTVDSMAGQGLSTENLAQALGMTATDLQQLLTKLTGQQGPQDLWVALGKMDDQISAVLGKIAAALNGAENAILSKKDAQAAVALFKLVDLVAPKTDLLLKQELQSSQMKDWLTTLAATVTTKTTEKAVALPFANKLFNFKPIVATETQSTQQLVPTATATKATVVTMTLPTAPQAQASKFVEEFQSIMNRAQFASNAASTRLLIKLYPENLGTIRLELIQKDGVLSAKLLASTALGKQMLDSSLHQLKQGFVSQNIQLDRLEVTQALSEPNKGERGHQFGQNTPNNKGSDDEEHNDKKVENHMSFDDLLAEMEE
ncbi:flagellar hook-length control protein FliK [Kurthia sibirica]|uniref:Flagellar hook-length control protein-like C-terminal domain-containing protein n=1 Tax=Kurthia sibirica TaxID=202750 RepID=A0A2U3AQW1_9BACL|nr:flagellar hook-length control protein FliK [Kurthia sibirica]PWI26899.1 hypothetical protein DEX24_00955 [Kurthia sibirica]GEK32560.1 hypothetical protein KSI01_00930 [Kurthia sibirica]